MKDNAITIGVSIISLILSIAIIWYLCSQGGCSGIKNISFGDASVAVLGAIVGLLVGWQIYKTIDIDKKIDAKIDEEVKVSRYLMEKRINDIQREVKDSEENMIRNLRDVSTLLLDFNDDGKYSFINDAFTFYYCYSKANVDGIAKRMSFNLIVAALDKESIDDNKEITRLNRVQVRFFLDEYEKTENPKPYVIGNLRKIINQ